MRVFARRERAAPRRAAVAVRAADGWRYSLWVTNLAEDTPGWRARNAYTGASHRAHARVEDGIRTGKSTGASRFPSHSFAVNAAWLSAALLAAALLRWLAGPDRAGRRAGQG